MASIYARITSLLREFFRDEYSRRIKLFSRNKIIPSATADGIIFDKVLLFFIFPYYGSFLFFPLIFSLFMKKTKIIATVGPATESEEQLIALYNAGANIIRFNFSHANYENVSAIMARIRKLNKE